MELDGLFRCVRLGFAGEIRVGRPRFELDSEACPSPKPRMVENGKCYVLAVTVDGSFRVAMNLEELGGCDCLKTEEASVTNDGISTAETNSFIITSTEGGPYYSRFVRALLFMKDDYNNFNVSAEMFESGMSGLFRRRLSTI